MRLYGNTETTANNAPPIYAVLSLLLGASLWGLIWYPMRLLEQRGLDGVWLALILYGAAWVVSLPGTAATFRELHRYPISAALIAASAGWTNVTFVLAVLEGNILRVMLLFYLSPVWAIVLARLFLHERITPRAWFSLAVSLIGTVVMLWDPALGTPWPQMRADWLALSAGFAFAVSNVAIRKSEHLSIAAKSVNVWLGVVCVAVVWILASSLPVPAATPAVYIAAVLLGGIGILVMTVLVQYGVSRLPIQRSAIIMLFELVVGAASQQWLTDESMTVKEWIGGALIVLAAYQAMRRP